MIYFTLLVDTEVGYISSSLFYWPVTTILFMLTVMADNGVPVHLKGGAGDAVLYRATMGLTVLGTLFVLYELGKASLPQKKE